MKSSAENGEAGSCGEIGALERRPVVLSVVFVAVCDREMGGHCYGHRQSCVDMCGTGVTIRDTDGVRWIYCHADRHTGVGKQRAILYGFAEALVQDAKVDKATVSAALERVDHDVITTGAELDKYLFKTYLSEHRDRLRKVVLAILAFAAGIYLVGVVIAGLVAGADWSKSGVWVWPTRLAGSSRCWRCDRSGRAHSRPLSLWWMTSTDFHQATFSRRSDAWAVAASFAEIGVGVDVAGTAAADVVVASVVDVEVIDAARLSVPEEHAAARSVRAKTPAVREGRVRVGECMVCSLWVLA